MRRFVLAFCLVALPAVFGACTTYQSELQRGINHYKNEKPEQAIVVLQSLEGDIDSLSAEDKVKYAYYRGMADYRISEQHEKARNDARYWLSLAKAGADVSKGSLTEDERAQVEKVLAKLMCDVYLNNPDCSSMADAPKDDKSSSKKDDKKKSSDDDAPKKKSKDADSDDAPKKKDKKKRDELQRFEIEKARSKFSPLSGTAAPSMTSR